jgi:hypothetical protein
MIDRRKLMLASLAGIVAPVCAVFAQQASDHMDDHARADEHAPAAQHEQPHADVHAAAARPRMPALRHEVRPRAPGANYQWRAGRWNWDGRQWAWVAGVWYR